MFLKETKKILLVVILMISLTISLSEKADALTINSLEQDAEIIVNCSHQNILGLGRSDCSNFTQINNLKNEQENNIVENENQEITNESEDLTKTRLDSIVQFTFLIAIGIIITILMQSILKKFCLDNQFEKLIERIENVETIITTEFAEEDRNLSEVGMSDYAEMLDREDQL